MNPNFIVNSKLSLQEKLTISIYLIISFFILISFSETNNHQKEILFFYTFATHWFIYFFQYRALRNFRIYLIWILIGIFHLYVYFKIKDDELLSFVEGHASTGFRNTILLLVLFQILRFSSLEIQKMELVAPSRGSSFDIYDNREITYVDYISFIIYFVIGGILYFAI